MLASGDYQDQEDKVTMVVPCGCLGYLQFRAVLVADIRIAIGFVKQRLAWPTQKQPNSFFFNSPLLMGCTTRRITVGEEFMGCLPHYLQEKRVR